MDVCAPSLTVLQSLIVYGRIDTKAILIAPKHLDKLTTQRRNQIVKCLATRYDGHAAVIRRLLPSELELWGKVKISGAGDTIHAAELVQMGEGHRDATYVRVSNTLLCLHKRLPLKRCYTLVISSTRNRLID